MADDWEQLAEDWKDHPVGLIGEIDCTTEEGLALCEDFEIQVRVFSFETIVRNMSRCLSPSSRFGFYF